MASLVVALTRRRKYAVEVSAGETGRALFFDARTESPSRVKVDDEWFDGPITVEANLGHRFPEEENRVTLIYSPAYEDSKPSESLPASIKFLASVDAATFATLREVDLSKFEVLFRFDCGWEDKPDGLSYASMAPGDTSVKFSSQHPIIKSANYQLAITPSEPSSWDKKTKEEESKARQAQADRNAQLLSQIQQDITELRMEAKQARSSITWIIAMLGVLVATVAFS